MVSRRQNKNNAVILLYHGVTDAKSRGIENFSGKHILKGVFESHLRFIKKNNHILSLRGLIDHIASKKPFPEYSVAVTFDDGFENNFRVALPLLEKCKIPATFFLSTAFLGGSKMFWVDKIEHAVNMTSRDEVSLGLGGKDWEFRIKTKMEKITFLIKIKGYIKRLNNTLREAYVSKLINYLEVDCRKVDDVPNYRKLSWDQVKKMARSPLVEIGAHSHTHAKLLNLTSEDLTREVVLPKKELERHLKAKVDLFSYPEGQMDDYNRDVIDILKKNGYIASPSAMYGYNSLNSDLFHLKRIFVGFMGERFPLSF